jgi:DNA (cytosine-5)-methyltransferase 1
MNHLIVPGEGGLADDLFAGAGGWDLAAAQLGIHARGIENMKEARATRDAAGLETIHDDVWTFRPKYVARGGALVPIASGLIASPPCQTFSAAGKGSGRKALDDVLTVLPQVKDMTLAELRKAGEVFGDDRTALVLTPLWFALHHDYEWLAWEQVPTVLPVWQACAEALREAGWSVWTGNLQAEMFGVPQTRKRAFLLASKTGEVAPPTPTHSRYYSRSPAKLDEGVAKWVSMAEGLGWGLIQRPSFTITGGSSHAASGIEWGGASVREQLIDLAANDPEAWRAKGWGLTDRPSPTITGGGTETGGAEPIAKLDRYTSREDWLASPSGITGPCVRPLDHPAATVTGTHNYYAFTAEEWERRNPERDLPEWAHKRPATTVVGSFCPDVIAAPGYRTTVSRQNALNSVRVTVAEAGILQSFPADYPWQGTKGKQYLQAGNAIPPGLALHALASAARIALHSSSDIRKAS